MGTEWAVRHLKALAWLRLGRVFMQVRALRGPANRPEVAHPPKAMIHRLGPIPTRPVLMRRTNSKQGDGQRQPFVSHGGITHCGRDVGVTHEALHLVDGHSSLE